MTKPTITPYKLALQYARWYGRLGLNPKCWICGYAGIWALFLRNKKIVCYECILGLLGKSRIEKHHVWGHKRGPRVPLPGNFHRLLSSIQECGCYDTLMSTSAGFIVLLLFVVYERLLRRDMRAVMDPS